MRIGYKGFILSLGTAVLLTFGSTATAKPHAVSIDLPNLYHVFQTYLGQEKSDAILKKWMRPEIKFFLEKIRGLDHSLSNANWIPESDDDLIRRYGSLVFGVLGEAHLNMIARTNYPDLNLLNELDYDCLNQKGKKPDGLLYTINGKFLVIHRVLEAKLGNGGYNPIQARSYRHEWRKARGGISISYHGRVLAFPSDRIHVQLSKKTIPIQKLSQLDLEKITILMRPEGEPPTEYPMSDGNSNFRGTVYTFPVYRHQLHLMAEDYLRLRYLKAKGLLENECREDYRRM